MGFLETIGAGFDNSSNSTNESKQEDQRIAADHSFVAQLQGDVKGDVIFTDPGALAFGEKSLEKSLDFAAAAFQASSAAQSETLTAGRGELDSVLSKILGAAVPVIVVGLIVWAVKK